jgi:hypothetical protein
MARLSLARRLLTVAAIATTSVLVIAQPAHASAWQFSDNLNDGFNGWVGTVYNNDGTASFTTRDGNGYAVMTKYNNSWWNEVGRNVRISPAALHRTTCSAKISLKTDPTLLTTANIEIIDPTTWNYLAFRQVEFTNGNWQQFTVGPWVGGPTEIRFRVSLLVKTFYYRYLAVDNLVVQCQYY